MQFKPWFLLSENVKLVYEYLPTHQVINLGKMGWWTVMSALKSNAPQGKIIGLVEYNRSKNNFREDYLAEEPSYSQMKTLFETAAHQLAAKAGLPNMHQICIVVDLSDKKNQITGGGVGGTAHDKSHGMEVDRSNLGIDVISHEHAHMFWFNLPKENRETFRRYYFSNIKRMNFDDADYQNVWKQSALSFDKQKLTESIENSWHNFREKFGSKIHKDKDQPDPELWFRLNQATEEGNDQKIIAYGVMRRFRSYCNAKLRKSISVSHYSDGHIVLEPDEDVMVEAVSERYIINFYKDNQRYEYKKSFGDR